MATHLSSDDSMTSAPLLDLQRVFDLSQDLMCMTDAHTRFVRVSASSARILGYQPDELLGRKCLDLIYPNDLQATLLAHETVLRGAQVVEFENRYVRKDGTLVELSWTSTWLAGAGGAGATYSVARDITNRKRAERLRESQREVLQMIVAGSTLGDVLRRICSIMEVFDADARCAVTVLDGAGGRVRTAFSPSLPSRFLSVVQDALLGMPHGACAHALRSGRTATCADITKDPDWRELAALGAEHGLRACWFTPVFGARGRLIAVIAVYYPHPYEPSDRELVLVQAAVSLVALAIAHANAQTQLKESLTRVELAQAIARLGYWERDLSNDKLNVYGETTAILGIPGERSVSLASFLGVVLEADRPALIAAYSEANRGDGSAGLQFRVRHPDGSVRYVHAERRVIRDESGRPTHIIGTMQDVTERNEADRERQRYLTQLAALAAAARKVNSVLTVDELLQVITDIARDLVGAHVAVCVLKSADDATVECCKTSHSEKYTSVAPDSVLQEGRGLTVSLAAASGRRIGVLCVADKQSGEFASNDERVLSQLADLAAVGLENAHLYAELEERVRKRTAELQESNKELEAFSYSVSHDLRGPLRAIAGFTGLLRDRHYETIDADGRRCIDRVLAGTQRMSNLIDDLLELGRVTRVEFRRRQVDLSEYVRAALTRLREASPERAAAIVIEPQLVVDGDAGLLEIALENLLDNAWKFTASRPVAEIRFGALAADGVAGDENERTFFVQDNGVGFDLRYATNLFGVFQRLHAAGEFPGTGVGLATVQRIVQRHGGRIWADAAVDRGATIYFSIAKGQQ
ncbi:PAS domain S-box protein [Steroidobacter agaridevorans]|nr:PAS domain S-box protein [Steroidobacter agaridevorans]